MWLSTVLSPPGAELTPWSCRCSCSKGRAGVSEGLGMETPGGRRVGGVERCLGKGAGRHGTDPGLL